jgi:hypothetical protein
MSPWSRLSCLGATGAVGSPQHAQMREVEFVRQKPKRDFRAKIPKAQTAGQEMLHVRFTSHSE